MIARVVNPSAGGASAVYKGVCVGCGDGSDLGLAACAVSGAFACLCASGSLGYGVICVGVLGDLCLTAYVAGVIGIGICIGAAFQNLAAAVITNVIGIGGRIGARTHVVLAAVVIAFSGLGAVCLTGGVLVAYVVGKTVIQLRTGISNSIRLATVVIALCGLCAVCLTGSIVVAYVVGEAGA